MAKIRLFFANFPDVAASNEINALMHKIHWPNKVVYPDINNLHLTLCFLGEVEEAAIPEIIKIADNYQGKKFELILEQFSYWKVNQLAWLAPIRVPKELIKLAKYLAQEISYNKLAKIGTREFKPHVTIARKVSEACAEIPDFLPIRWQVENFCLVESRPSQIGSEYIKIICKRF